MQNILNANDVLQCNRDLVDRLIALIRYVASHNFWGRGILGDNKFGDSCLHYFACCKII